MVHGRGAVVWIGGGTCSGKSTLAREVAAALGHTLVSIDDSFDEHVAELPGSTVARIAGMPVCSRLAQAVKQQVDDVWAIAEERWPLVSASLAADSVIEGEAILPARLASVGIRTDSALFLVVSPHTRRERYAARPWARELVAGCADPDAAFAAWMRRDELVQERIVAEATAYGFPVFDGDTARGLADARMFLTGPATP